MTGPSDDPSTIPGDDPPSDWEVTREDVERWYAMHPDAFPGFDAAPLILNERRRVAADVVRATWPDLPDVLIVDALPKLAGRRRSMADELVDLIAPYHPLPGLDDITVTPARLVRRGAGRPGWTKSQFLVRLHEAESKAAPSTRLADIAAVFRRLDGRIGVDPDYLRRRRAEFAEPT